MCYKLCLNYFKIIQRLLICHKLNTFLKSMLSYYFKNRYYFIPQVTLRLRQVFTNLLYSNLCDVPMMS